jgi:hypothetical protein
MIKQSKNIPNFGKVRRRYQSLLEVLIAFVLVAMCVLPLIYPHIAIYKAQKSMVDKAELDHVVNLLYAKILENLYLNVFSWHELEQATFQVDSAMLEEIQFDKPFPFTGSFNFNETPTLHKPKKLPALYSLYLFKLTFHFLHNEYKNASDEIKKKKTTNYTYDVFVVRDLEPGAKRL